MALSEKASACDFVAAGQLPLRTVDDFLDALLGRALLEDVSAAPQPWGEKLGFSIFDEDEILGRGSATPSPLRSAGRSWIDELADELEQLPGWSDDDFDDGSGSDADSVDGSAWAAETTDAAAALVPPRAVRSALSFCCAYRLQENLPEPCPICLDDFARGQEAWRLPCTHIFHASCIMSSFGMRRAKITCPLCRCDVKRLAVASPSEISAAVATPGVIG